MAVHEAVAAAVARGDGQARQPAAYRLRVLLLGLLGYAYVFGVLAALVGLVGLIVWLAAQGHGGRAWAVKAVIALGALALVVVRALWVRMPPPWGLRLRPEEAPALFAVIEEVRRRSRGPRVHRLLIDDEFNAGVRQVPRLGVLGWPRNYLVLGLPLLQALSAAQFRAVLAHEFGHLSGAHNLVSGWIYRVRGTWEQLVAALERDEHWGTFVFRPFFRWYVPLFDRYSFSLRRAQEYEADRNAARVAGTREFGDALAALAVYGDFLHRVYWAGIGSRAAEEPEPTLRPHGAMGEALRVGPPPADAQTALEQRLRAEPEADDTHPTLADRLAALREAPRVPSAPGESAAERYLGQALPALAERLDEAWRGSVREAWRERHTEAAEARRRLAALEGRTDLDPEETWRRAALTEEVHGAHRARPLYEAILAARPDDAPALYAVGRLRLDAGDEGGLALLERAMAADEEAIQPACQVACAFLSARGRRAEAEGWTARYREHRARADAREAARRRLDQDTRFATHGLPAEQLDPLVRDLAGNRDVAAAYLVRKVVEAGDTRPCFLLGVERRGWFSGDEEARGLSRTLAALDSLPEGQVLVLMRHTRWLRERLRTVPGALVYRRT